MKIELQGLSGEFAIIANLAALIASATISFPSRSFVEGLTAVIVLELAKAY
jgi:hypothetical protein